MDIFWFRRDLRLDDNAGLYHALKNGEAIQSIFIFDPHILDHLTKKKDRRLTLIHRQLSEIQGQLNELGATLWVFFDKPAAVFKKLQAEEQLSAVYCNHDYEPYAKERDLEIKNMIEASGAKFFSFKDQVIFEGEEVRKNDGKPYTVFTPYGRKWRATLTENHLQPYPTLKFKKNFKQARPATLPSLEEMGFEPDDSYLPEKKIPMAIIKHYGERRNFPFEKSTSRMGPHLRFGTLSIRRLAQVALQTDDTYLNELIWREFNMMILDHFPHIVDSEFKPAYANIPWLNDKKHFEAWKAGKTGYPIVDAGMRELNETGFMHNRVRMVVASFLSKHLLIDWRWGERYFAEKLIDFELASNVGGWQWAAGCGCDAAPYFRVFNPELQQKKFDPDMVYVKKWLPEYGSAEYPQPIVEHKFARERAIETYKTALKGQGAHF